MTAAACAFFLTKCWLGEEQQHHSARPAEQQLKHEVKCYETAAFGKTVAAGALSECGGCWQVGTHVIVSCEKVSQ